MSLVLPGYSGNGRPTCADVDECTQGTHQCDVNAVCANNVGSYTCTCNQGNRVVRCSLLYFVARIRKHVCVGAVDAMVLLMQGRDAMQRVSALRNPGIVEMGGGGATSVCSP